MTRVIKHFTVFCSHQNPSLPAKGNKQSLENNNSLSYLISHPVSVLPLTCFNSEFMLTILSLVSGLIK